MTTALVVVDVQPTFCEGGDLEVPGGNAVVPKINDFLREQHDKIAVTAGSRDFHPEDLEGEHFEIFGPHGVQGTSNAEYHPELATSYIDVHVKKGQKTAAFSAFEGVDFDYRTLDEIFERIGVKRVLVCGIATEYCVLETALDAKRLGYEVAVLMDLTAAVGGDEAKDETTRTLIEAGIEIL